MRRLLIESVERDRHAREAHPFERERVPRGGERGQPIGREPREEQREEVVQREAERVRERMEGEAEEERGAVEGVRVGGGGGLRWGPGSPGKVELGIETRREKMMRTSRR